MRTFVSTIGAAMLAVASAGAQDRTAEIDKIFSWVAPNMPGCTVAAAHNGQTVVNRAYGLADLERDVPLKPETLFDVGSVRKQFVAAAILMLVEEGKLALTDDVRKHLPEFPDYGHKITLDHMLTHTSGIRDWVGLLNLADGNADAWSAILRQRGLQATPGEEWSYSNSNYVLLPEIVTRVSGMPFAEFARRRLFEPLGMKQTLYVTDLRDVVKNRALAYEKAGTGWKQDMLIGNERGGAGGLFSTASDLLIWNDALTSKRLGAFVSDKLQEPATLNNGRKLTTAGRGLFMETYRGAKMISYTGSANAYKAYLGRFPELNLSIAILCNAGDGANRTLYAQRIFALFAPAAPAPDPESGAPPPNTGEALADVNARAGLYFNEKTGDPLRLAVDRDRFRVLGGPALVPVEKDRYRRWGATAQFMSEDKFELQFLSKDQFELKSMEGATTRYRRAQAFAPSEAELKAFAGRYQSDDLKAVLDLTPGKTGLLGRLNDTRGDALPLAPVDRDTFQIAQVTMRFKRDAAGKVIGLDFSNPLLRAIPFTRVGDK